MAVQVFYHYKTFKVVSAPLVVQLKKEDCINYARSFWGHVDWSTYYRSFIFFSNGLSVKIIQRTTRTGPFVTFMCISTASPQPSKQYNTNGVTTTEGRVVIFT